MNNGKLKLKFHTKIIEKKKEKIKFKILKPATQSNRNSAKKYAD